MARWDRDDDGSSVPEWFFEAVETPYQMRSVEVDECDVVYQLWGDAGKPGILLIHGMNAHAHWWDFIAPHFLPDHQVAAMNLTGMGDSDYRYEYDGTTYAQEIKAVCDHAGFSNDVVVVAHSFGGYMAVKAANLFPERFGALILVDSGIRHPDEPIPDMPHMGGRAKAYPDKQTALGRFRVQPPQTCENTYVLEYIARHSLMPVDGGGWAWKFDEDLPGALKDVERSADDYQNLAVPLGLIYGADSELFSQRTEAYMRELVPQDFPSVALENAQHHLFLDQPLAFVDSLTQMLSDLGEQRPG
ncbi:MAG: alpha/beta hydrolase [Gammaproteobacteria bacterium]|nr:alpha/beta hydrolase [Gammaproteobacteria bacterium]